MKNTVKKLITISALTTAGIHIANRVIEYSATQRNLLTTERGHFYDWKYGRIFYTKEGNGEPIVLIHDLSPDSSGYEWKKVVNNLSKNYTVYTVDLLGCGRSEKPAMSYTGYIYVQFLNDFIKDIVRKEAYVACTGFSSMFTIMASFMAPDNYKKIIYINPTSPEEFDTLPQEEVSIAKKIFELPIIGTYLYNLSVRKNSISQELTGGDYNSLSDFIDAYYEAAHLDNGRGRFLYASMWDEYLNVNVRRGLMECKVPMHILESAEVAEDENLLSQYQFYNEAITGTVIRNTRFIPQIEDPKKTAEEIRSFL